MMEVPHFRQRRALAVCLHTCAHLERGAVCERRAEHAPGVDAGFCRAHDALREHLGLSGSGRGQHEVPPGGNRHHFLLLIGEIHAVFLSRTTTGGFAPVPPGRRIRGLGSSSSPLARWHSASLRAFMRWQLS